ncbi:MAG TPA: DUF3052 domain-containing protein [Gemmatimonadales bacterium]|nr:DUF3052 domain-containing protein [Gemmatimonadales bacterium]
MAAGYSTRRLTQKLGIKPGTSIVALDAPPAYSSLLGKLPDGATLHTRLGGSATFIQWFVRHRNELETTFPRLARALVDQGTLWVSWPKQASGVKTDLNENIIRDVGLDQGLVDVKVIAVDEVWSGLKFVRRMENRG